LFRPFNRTSTQSPPRDRFGPGILRLHTWSSMFPPLFLPPTRCLTCMPHYVFRPPCRVFEKESFAPRFNRLFAGRPHPILPERRSPLTALRTPIRRVECFSCPPSAPAPISPPSGWLSSPFFSVLTAPESTPTQVPGPFFPPLTHIPSSPPSSFSCMPRIFFVCILASIAE